MIGKAINQYPVQVTMPDAKGERDVRYLFAQPVDGSKLFDTHIHQAIIRLSHAL